MQVFTKPAFYKIVVHNHSVSLKIKFLDKAYIAYFSAKFNRNQKSGTKLKTP